MKILVNVYIPAISEHHDVLIPNSLKIKTVIDLVANTVEKLSNHLYIVSGEERLCSVEKNVVLRPNSTLEQYGIKNGEHLVMM